MSTTAVVAEILVVGLQAEAWIVILVLARVDSAIATAWLKQAEPWSTLLTTAALAMAYALGVVVDRCADRLFAWQDAGRKLPARLGNMRMTVMAKSEPMAKFLEYQRSRLRIARGTVLNVVLTVASAVFLLVARSRTDAIGWVVGVGAVAMGVTLFVTFSINDAFMKRLRDAYEMVKDV